MDKIFGTHGSFLQTDGDLGIKMQNAFRVQFTNGYDKIILMGSDTPQITNQILDEAFKKLDDYDTILGPSMDGGYYLIAFQKNSFSKKPFRGISWSTSMVLKQTLQRLNTRQVYFLQELNDIDNIDDLAKFYTDYQSSYFKDSNTMQFLKKSKKWKNLMLSSSEEDLQV